MESKLFISKLAFPSLCVALMLQRSPVVRFVAGVEFSLIPRVQHMWAVVVGAVTVGAYNTVTAATGDIKFASGQDDITGAVGEEFRVVIEVEGSLTPETWIVLGDLPAGVTSNINFGIGIVTISGIPTVSGSFPITIQAWQRSNMRGDRGPDLNFTIKIAQIGPDITQQPLSRSVDLGGSTELSLTLSDAQGATYQWQKQNAANSEVFHDLSGQTSATLNLSNVTFDDTGNYRVVVTKDSIVEESELAMVTVNSLISQHPSNQSADWNGTAELSVVIKDPEGVTYQWQKQNADNPELYDDLPGQTGAVLSLTNVNSKNAGSYQVIATKGSAIEVSMIAVLTVNATSYQAWLDTYFEDPFSVEAGEEQNNDFDNTINLIESLFGGDPAVADSFPFPEVSQEVINETHYAVFRYPAVPVGAESQITPEATDDLVGNVWTPLQNGVEGVIVESSAEGYFVKIPSELRKFLRLLCESAL